MTTRNRMVTAGETDGNRERPVPGCPGLAGQVTLPVREDSLLATENITEQCPLGRAKSGEDEIPIRQNQQPTTTPDISSTIENTPDNLCSCGKTLKNKRGLKINQGKMAARQS